MPPNEDRSSPRFSARLRELKFKQLLVFERVMVLGSMHKAAQALHMSQPNVFKIVSQLESLLDVPLFERHSRGVHPTFFAQRLLQRIQPLLGDARAMDEELTALRSGEQGQVAVGTLISASARLLPESIARMKQQHPLVHISVREATNDLLFPMLAAGELDMVVGRVPEQLGEGIHYQALYQEQLVLVARPAHPLALKADWPLAVLQDYPWIVPTPESAVRAEVEGFFAQLQLPLPDNRIESLSMLTNLGVLRQSDTLALLPRTAAQSWLEAQLITQLPLPHTIGFGAIGIGLRTQRSPTPSAQAFLAVLHQVAHDWVQQQQPS